MKLVFLEDITGVKLSPITHERSVRDDNGDTLESKLQSISEDITSLQELYEDLAQSAIVPVALSDWPIADPEQGVIYRVAGTTSYTDYMYDGTDFIAMATYSNAIDDLPTEDSENLVKSGGVYSFIDGAVDEKLENYAQINGSYDTMAVGIANNLEGRILVEGTFLERITGGDADVANGLGQIQEIQGNSIKFNQLVYNQKLELNGQLFPSGDYTASYDSNTGVSTFVFDGLSDTKTYSRLYLTYYCEDGTLNNTHVYYICFEFVDATGITMLSENPDAKLYIVIPGHRASIGTQNIAKGNKIALIRTISSVNQSSSYTVGGENTDSAKFTVAPNGVLSMRLQIIDLTQIFGEGNEPSTVAEFEAWLKDNIGLREYYEYDEGSIINNNMVGIESTGFNLFNPTTGKARIIGAYNEVYGNYYGITGTYGALTFEDDLGNVSTITPDADGKFELDVPGYLSVADAGNDVAVFLWWDGTKIEYEPYEKHEVYVDVKHIYGKLNGEGSLVQVWPNGMPKVNNIVDKLCVENGAVAAKRPVGEQSVTGVIDDTVTLQGCDTSTISFLCGSNIGTLSSGVLTLTAAATDVIVYYPLATPETYTDLVYMGSEYFADGTPVTLPVNYNVDNLGVESILTKNTTQTNTAPATLVCKYSVDAVEELDTLHTEVYNNRISVSDLKANLTSLTTYLCTNYPEVFTPAFAVNDEPNAGTNVFGFHEVVEPEPQPEPEPESEP